MRILLQGGLASVLAVAGLVVFATEASAHNNFFESVTGACNSAPGSGATLTWTLYNDWNLSESGAFSTAQGILSTTILSIAASPTENATPPAAASQVFTQTLTASELAALSPSSIISVDWSATWTDSTSVSGTLSTTLSALNLPNGCVPPKTTPTITTTLAPPTSTTLGNSWGDSATVTGSTGGAAPGGSVGFNVCKSSTSPSSPSTCTTGGSLVGTVSSPSSSSGNASTYNLGTRYTPPDVGTYCFYTTYAPAEVDNYTAASGPAECFSVTAPNFTVTKTDVPASGTSVAPGSTINYTVAIKNVGDGAGSATVTDVVPSALTVKGTPVCAVTSPDTCSVAHSGGSTWTFTVSLAASHSATATFAALVAATATGTITNTATITAGPCTTSSGCSSTVSNPVTPVVIAATVTPPTTVSPATVPPTTVPPTTTPATTPTIAFTGAFLSQEWMIGLAALLLGSGLVIAARWRRRNPGTQPTK